MSRIEKLKGILAPVPTFIDETGDVGSVRVRLDTTLLHVIGY